VGKERTVLNYGAGDLGWVSPHSPVAQRELGRLLSETIAAFEPRLTDVHVEVERYLPRTQGLELVITSRCPFRWRCAGRAAEPRESRNRERVIHY
jgi:predicted component of type VI protein secretion system